MTEANPTAGNPALEVRSLSKSYGAVRALNDVSLSVAHGEILGLLGDNGAGKSTLVKCLSGLIKPDHGEILLDGVAVELPDVDAARRIGMETVYQNLALVPTLDVAANLFLNREEVRGGPVMRRLGWMNRDKMHRQTREILKELGVTIRSTRQEAQELSGGQRQAVAIGRSVAWGRRVVLFDEPAAALGVEQARHVLDLARSLRDRGAAVLLISHNMQQVMEVCDRAVVLRLGVKVGDVRISEVTAQTLVTLITGAAAEV
jgi:simple sugar transport system ATP-binding protein